MYSTINRIKLSALVFTRALIQMPPNDKLRMARTITPRPRGKQQKLDLFWYFILARIYFFSRLFSSYVLQNWDVNSFVVYQKRSKEILRGSVIKIMKNKFHKGFLRVHLLGADRICIFVVVTAPPSLKNSP